MTTPTEVPEPPYTPPPGERMPRWVPRAILLFFITLVGFAVVGWLILRLQSLLIMLLVSLFLSLALEPAVNRLANRGWRRGPATGLVFLGLLIAIGLFLWAIGSLLVTQIQDFADEAPAYVEDIENWINDTFDADVDASDIGEEIQESDLASGFADELVSAGRTAVTVIFQLFTIALFTFYLVADGPRMRRAILSTLPEERQREVLRVWEIAIDKTGGYIYSRGLLALISTVAHWIAFAIIGVPFALPLALWVGVVSQFVPTVGTYIAGALPLLIALIDDPVSAIWVLGFVAVYQQIENYLLAPPVTAQTMDIHPAVAFGGVIAGASILGVVGALLALPAAATIQAFISTYVERHEVVETDLTTKPRERLRLFSAIRFLRRNPRESSLGRSEPTAETPD